MIFIAFLSAILSMPLDASPGVDDAPLFFEINPSRYIDSLNVQLLPQGRIRLQPLGIESVEGFDWVHHHRKDKSWWLQIERCTYLLPFIESDDSAQRTLAKEWFYSWYRAHQELAQPNPGAWEGMTAGMRAMVFVLYLKRELHRPSPDQQLIETLTTTIEHHQKLLAKPELFERNNHGMWQATGLFETTRAVDNTELAAIAFSRLQELLRLSVSDLGIHREHSPQYHILFSSWLADYVRYFESTSAVSEEDMSVLRATSARMQKLAYYLHDHDGNLAQIGDTDAQRLSPPGVDTSVAIEPVLFDRQAAYAVFKDPPAASNRRHVVLNIQTEETLASTVPSMTSHFHQDVGAVYYSDEGEIVLSDQGRFAYSWSGRRQFFQSPAAHNVVLPTAKLKWTTRARGIIVADAVWHSEDEERVVFGIALFQNSIRRHLDIPKAESHFTVVDSIARSAGPGDYTALWNIGSGVVGIESLGVTGEPGERTYTWSLTTRRGRRFQLSLTILGSAAPSGHAVNLVKGGTNPLLGWYSPSHHKMSPSSVIKVHLRPLTDLVVTTRIRRDH